jgi:hypothetical protein
MRITLLPAALLAGLCLSSVGAAPASAQNVVLAPKLGLYIPASGLGDFRDQTRTVARDRAGSLAIGLGLELDLPVLPVNLRGNLEFATGARVTAGGQTEREVESTLLAVVGDVVFRPIPRLIVVQPYFLLGGGMKWHEFQTSDLTAADRELFPADQSNATLHLGAGLDFTLGPLGLVVELSDYISSLDARGEAGRRLQNDVFAMVGIRVALF